MTHRILRLLVLVLAALAGVVRSSAASAPAPVTNLSARGTAPGAVTVTWDAVSSATEYRVYADVDPILQVFVAPGSFTVSANAQLVATVTGTSTIETGLTPMVRRYYAVVAANADGPSFPIVADWLVVPAPPDAAIFGLADLHTHQFSDQGFGHKLMWGSAFSPNGIFDALPFCDDAHGPFGV